MQSNMIKKLNTSRFIVALALTFIFLLMLFCNLRTNLVADDYRYCFSFADDTRIESVAQIFPSMAAHRHSMNGRLAAHFLVQLFLLLPLPVFKCLNALMFVVMIALVYRISRRENAHSALLLAAIFGAVWVLQPEFGQVYLWLDGSINYLWCAVLCLLWLMPQVSFFLERRELSKPAQAVYVLFSLLVGAYSENSTVALVFMALLFMALTVFYRKEKVRAWQLLSLLAMLIGFALMLFTPGEIGNKSAEFSLRVLLANFADTALYYLRFWPLLVFYGVLYFAHRAKGLSQDERLLSLVFFGGSLAGHFVLTFALYCAGRSTYIALILLLCACGILAFALFEGGMRRPITAVCVLCLCFTAYWGYRGVSDILRTNYLLTFNEQLITAAAENGERDVQLPRFYAETKYSAIEGLPYLELDDPNDWSNVYMAKYYGVDSVIGY